MATNGRNRRFSGLAAAAIAAIGLSALALSSQPAKAQFIGLDLGGVNIGIGAPPPAYYYGPPYYAYGYYGPYYRHRYYYGW